MASTAYIPLGMETTWKSNCILKKMSRLASILAAIKTRSLWGYGYPGKSSQEKKGAILSPHKGHQENKAFICHNISYMSHFKKLFQFLSHQLASIIQKVFSVPLTRHENHKASAVWKLFDLAAIKKGQQQKKGPELFSFLLLKNLLRGFPEKVSLKACRTTLLTINMASLPSFVLQAMLHFLIIWSWLTMHTSNLGEEATFFCMDISHLNSFICIWAMLIYFNWMKMFHCELRISWINWLWAWLKALLNEVEGP